MAEGRRGGARLRGGAVAALSLLLGVAACGGSAGSPSGVASSGGPPLQGSLTVLAAASLTEAFADGERRLESANPGFHATYSFAGSQQLVMNLERGAPADVVATADEPSMARLVAAGLVETPRSFARNRLEIVVGRGNPKAVRGLADLARPDLSLVLEDASVPAGRYARQALERAGVIVHPRSLELSVKAGLEKVASGDADAGIVYATDVAAAQPRVSGVVVPDDQNVLAVYPVAVVSAGHDRAAARAFADAVVGGAVQEALRARGFSPP